MDYKPSIDPENISMWVVSSVCIGLLALLLGGIVLNELRTTTLMVQGELLVLNKKLEEVRKLAQAAAAPAAAQPTGQPAQGATAPAASSAPTQPTGQPAK